MRREAFNSRADVLKMIFEERKDQYGNNYLYWGEVMDKLYPEGLTVKGVNDWNKLGVLVQIVSKLTRYTTGNSDKEIINDTLNDMSIYSQMLAKIEVDGTTPTLNEDGEKRWD